MFLLLLLASAEPHWAFQPVARHTGSIDAFLAARLANAGLSANPAADRPALLRRLSFDLLGLPPTPEEVRAFVEDTRADAYERVVDRYLASPHLGERWARHWLDVVRFAETTGFEQNAARPNAWPYRDFVIRAFNEDRPYDRFVRDQIAGDATGDDAATGFLVAGAYDAVKGDPKLSAQQRADELHDMIGTTSAAFLGLTAGCARCHDHKFDPIPQKDYYALKAVFEGVLHGERPVGRGERVVDPRRNEERFAAVEAKALRMTILATNNGTEPCIDEMEVYSGGKNVAPRAVPSSSGNYPGNPIHQLKHINDGRYGNSASWISDTRGRGWVMLTFPETVRLDRVVWSRDREGRYADRLPTHYRLEVAKGDEWRTVVEVRSSSATMIYAGSFTSPPATRRFWRGEVGEPREAVAPAALSSVGKTMKLAAGTPEQQRRVALAKWITDPGHPLTARVIVNRLWQHHFGVGLVATPSDFGRNGAKPSHPELLDFLASELVASGWSLKHVHRQILLSAGYRRSSAHDAKAVAADAGNRLLWRYPPRRLEAEPLRDAILSVSGALDTRMGGPGFDLFEARGNTGQGVKVYVAKTEFGPAEWRRMIYQTKPRMRLDDTFGAFDCPDAGLPAPSRLFAERLKREATTTPDQVRRGYRLAFQREPAADEVADGVELVREHGLTAFCRALFNANEFLHLD
jgi:hypothetical protein